MRIDSADIGAVQRRVSGVKATATIVALFAVIVLLALLASNTTADAADADEYTPVTASNIELPQPPGGGYTDASGITFNETTGELLVVDNRTDEILIYDNDPNWTYDRKVGLGAFNIQDLEGIAWMGGNKYAVVDEFGTSSRPNELMVFTLNGSTVTELYRDTLTSMPQVVNGGAEGIAFVSSANGIDTFYVVGETGTLWRATGQNGSVSLQQMTVNNDGVAALADFSDVGYVNDGGVETVYLANEEAFAPGRIRSYTVSGTTVTRSGADLTAGLANLEGIGFNADASRMFLTGEDQLEFREFTLNSEPVGDPVWALRNVVHGGYLRQDDGSINVSMSSTNDDRAKWRITNDASGTVFQNVATGRYLDADGTNSGGNIDTSTTVSLDDHWTVVDNGNAGLNIQNVNTNGWIDGDGIGVNIDQSTGVTADDYWERIIVNPGGPTPTPTPTPVRAGPDADAITFGAIGDWGVAGGGAPAVANLMAQSSPDIVITMGDNRYGSNTFDGVVGRHYCSWVKDAESGPNCPSGGDADINRFFPSTGNHDYTDAGGISEYLSYFDLPGAGVPSEANSGNELYYDITWGPVHFFMIDSQAFLQSSSNRAEQTAWLSNAVPASTKAWQIVVLHHAPYSSSDVHGSNPVLQLPYSDYGVDLVLAGHDHNYERLELDTAYVVNGLGGNSPRDLGAPIPGSVVQYTDDYGLSLFSATDTELVGEFIAVNGGVIDTFTLTQDGQPTVLGDVNCDGVIDDDDPLAITNYDVGNYAGVNGCPVAANEINLDAADVNDDGEVDVIDALLISQCVNGQANLFCPDLQPAFNGPHNVPGQVQAEDFDEGGQGVAFNEGTAANLGGAYRDTPVDVYPSQGEPGFTVGNTRDGEWLEYTVTSAVAQTLEISARVATGLPAPGELQLDVGGITVATVPVTGTGGWWSFANVSLGSHPLPAGDVVIRVTWIQVTAELPKINLDRLDFGTGGPGGPECGGLTQEAEDGELFGSMVALQDGQASGGTYVEAAVGSGGRPGVSGDYMVFCFDVPATADYRIDARVFALDSRDDSFYVSVDGGDLALWDLAKGPVWAIDSVKDRGGPDPAIWNLTAGEHEIRLYQREDGTAIDYLELVNVGGQGPTCGALNQEAEAGIVSGAVAVVNDGTASGGARVEAGPGVSWPPTVPSANYLELCFNIPSGGAGDYRIDARMLAPTTNDNSFFVSVDGGSAATWDIPFTAGWQVDSVKDRGGPDPSIYALGSGDHTIRFYQREDGTSIDTVTLVPVN